MYHYDMYVKVAYDDDDDDHISWTADRHKCC